MLPAKLKDYVVDGKVKYGINTVVNYYNLSCENFSFTRSLNKTCEPKSYKEAVLDSKWVEAMNNEIEALNRNNTWIITELPKGYGQKEGIYYEETFSPVVKMVTVRFVLSLVVQYDWNVYQLDTNNAFLYAELVEDVYMTLPKGYFSSNDKRVCKLQKSLYGLKQAPRKWNEKLTSMLCEYGFQQSKNDFSLYTKSKGIKVIKNDKGIWLSQRKYSLELLSEFGMLACKPYKISFLEIYKEFTCAGIQYSKSSNFQGTVLSLGKVKDNMFLAKSSAETEYRAMSSVTCEVIWILKILAELKIEYKTPVAMFCDNSSAMQIAANHVFHERTKHFEADLFFLREKISEGVIKTVKIKSEDNVSDLFTKGLPVVDHKSFSELLHLKDMFQA
nr:ribonuclease H-like domain-containing protein [Tanacetum cinerariifolium]